MNIGILGLPRTGTSATYQLIRVALPGDTLAYFEPAVDPQMPSGQSMLCKMLVAPLPDHFDPSPSWVASLDKCLLLHRDPRDRLISTLLFMMHWHSEEYAPLWHVEGFDLLLRYLETKEQDAELPLWPLFEHAYALRFGMSPSTAKEWLVLQQETLGYYADYCIDTAWLSYEKLITGQSQASLSAWLGHAVQVSIPHDPQRRSIKREGYAGAWRRWFTREDCHYFANIFAPWCALFGYRKTCASALLPGAQIDPATSSHYVKKWIRVYERGMRHAAFPNS